MEENGDIEPKKSILEDDLEDEEDDEDEEEEEGEDRSPPAKHKRETGRLKMFTAISQILDYCRNVPKAKEVIKHFPVLSPRFQSPGWLTYLSRPCLMELLWARLVE
jgi:hypothetical protein